MKTTVAVAILILLSFDKDVSAHRLDEYLQATTIGLEKNRVQVQLRLIPGVAVFPFVMATIDTNGDGVLSAREQQTYSERVLRDLSLTIDGDRLELQLISTSFPTTDAMKEGLGQIQIDFAAHVLRDGANRKLVFENHHQRSIGTYLVNCLTPEDPNIQITSQKRNYMQSLYELDYVQSGVQPGQLSLAWISDGFGWLASLAVVLLARLAVSRRKQARI